MFNPMPDISQRAIIIFYVCVVVLSGCDYNVKLLVMGKKELSVMALFVLFTLWALDISYL